MKKEEARQRVLTEWDRWPDRPGNPTGNDAMIFFGFLQRERPNLLMFRSAGDKWQTVHSWLLSGGRVSD